MDQQLISFQDQSPQTTVLDLNVSGQQGLLTAELPTLEWSLTQGTIKQAGVDICKPVDRFWSGLDVLTASKDRHEELTWCCPLST